MQFHILSFEGPDAYSQVGGLGTRVNGLVEALGNDAYETHLWFVGDPKLPGHEQYGSRHLHRWGQWISESCPGGVYDGEDAKSADYATSLPPYLLQKVLIPHLVKGGQAAILAEEWQTANAVLHLDQLLRRSGLRDRVSIFWNANNTFGFENINWEPLAQASEITTVSRYMKFRMHSWGVDPITIPNGLPPDAYAPVDRGSVRRLRALLKGRTVIAKMARWDPDKGWMSTLEMISALKQKGRRPLVIARGGTEPYGLEVLKAARAKGLRIAERENFGGGVSGMLDAMQEVDEIDLISLQSYVDPESRRVLFRSADVVLANSGHEPFGLVGLETMAVGGIACTGFSGEDYAIPGRNALVLQTESPLEFMGMFERLSEQPKRIAEMRRAGRSTARQYAWPEVIDRNFLPRLELVQSAPQLLLQREERLNREMVRIEGPGQSRLSAVKVRDAARYIRSA